MSEEGVSGNFVFLCFEHEPKVPARKHQETASIRTTLATTQTMIARPSPMPLRFLSRPHQMPGVTPHDVDLHGVIWNASSISTL